MNKKYFVADGIEMEKRKVVAEEFYHTILDPDEIPLIVTDEATLYDIYIGDELELIQKVKQKYEVSIAIKHFKIPFWKLLDLLTKHRLQNK